MKSFVIPAMIVGGMLVGCNSNKGGTDVASVKLETENDKVLYTLGYMMGQNLKRSQISEAELSPFFKGIKDSATGAKEEVNVAEYQQKVPEFFKGRLEKASVEEKKKGAGFLENFVKEGATKTASGLAYKMLTEGKGEAPKETDTVEVHYHGTLTDGTVFDSSVERGQPVSFPLNRVIRGWTEGVQLVKPGGKVKLVIPPELAYGDAGAPPKIPGGATLVFEVELFKVSKGDAAAAKAEGNKAPAPKAVVPAPKKK